MKNPIQPLIWGFLLFFSASLTAAQMIYPLSNEPIDVIIPCTNKDLDTLELCIESVRKYGADIRKVIVISKERLTESAEWFDEALYPFTKELIALEIFQGNDQKAKQFLNSPHTRIGWIYQQFLKLYAPFVIPNISSNVLVLDADVIFLNPISFMTQKGDPLLTISHQYYLPYFDHLNRLLPGIRRMSNELSGIAHHMLLQKPILEDLLQEIINYHHTDPWRAFCRCIDITQVYDSSFSEYETYFNFAVAKTHQAHLRVIAWMNITSMTPQDLEKYKSLGYSYVACHSYNRPVLEK